jgi:hypothetical protein
MLVRQEGRIEVANLFTGFRASNLFWEDNTRRCAVREKNCCSLVDLTEDLAATLREQAQLKTRTLTSAQLREKARAQWLEFRNAGGRAPDKTKRNEKVRERDATDDRGKGKSKGRSRGLQSLI